MEIGFEEIKFAQRAEFNNRNARNIASRYLIRLASFATTYGARVARQAERYRQLAKYRG